MKCHLLDLQDYGLTIVEGLPNVLEGLFQVFISMEELHFVILGKVKKVFGNTTGLWLPIGTLLIYFEINS